MHPPCGPAVQFRWHGGGEGRTSGGRHPVTPWGKGTKGNKTRKSKHSDKLIVRSRNAKKGR